MGRTVEELLESISGAELQQWKIYYSVQPFGPEHDEWLHGVVASTIANTFRGKGHKALTPDDFMQPYSRRKARKARTKNRTAVLQDMIANGAID